MKRALAIAATTGLAGALAIGLQGRLSEPTLDRLPQTGDRAVVADTKDEHPVAEREPKHVKREPQQEERTEPKRRRPRELAVGLKGPDVKALQQTLTRLTYDPGPADGSFGYMTQHAVLAFEKVNGLELDGVVTTWEAKRIARSGPPRSPGPGSYVDVDITRQVLFEVSDGEVVHTLPISTANGATYESRSGLATAYTPRGRFSIYSKSAGWRESYLGSLYNPSYFYGGYAIHGSASVPPYPASHGCVRIPMHSADEFFARNGIGTEVLVHD